VYFLGKMNKNQTDKNKQMGGFGNTHLQISQPQPSVAVAVYVVEEPSTWREKEETARARERGGRA
jgi:hypothetical protein